METLIWIIGVLAALLAISLVANWLCDPWKGDWRDSILVELLAFPTHLLWNALKDRLAKMKMNPTDRRYNEMARLVVQLDARDSHGNTGRKNVEAAQRLGEIGNVGVLGALERHTQSFDLSLVLAAKEAIRKIKERNQIH